MDDPLVVETLNLLGMIGEALKVPRDGRIYKRRKGPATVELKRDSHEECYIIDICHHKTDVMKAVAACLVNIGLVVVFTYRSDLTTYYLKVYV